MLPLLKEPKIPPKVHLIPNTMCFNGEEIDRKFPSFEAFGLAKVAFGLEIVGQKTLADESGDR